MQYRGRGNGTHFLVETMGDISQIEDNESNYINTAKNYLGMGPGSKYNPIKAAVVEDDEEEKMGNDEIAHRSGSTNNSSGEHVVTDSWSHQLIDVSTNVRNIIEELDEIIDIDREQEELNYMFMDENNTDNL